MAFQIKTIRDADKPRAYVTVQEVDGGVPIPGREWTEPFDTEKKDWDGLKKRINARVYEDDQKKTTIETLTNEAVASGLTAVVPTVMPTK